MQVPSTSSSDSIVTLKPEPSNTAADTGAWVDDTSMTTAPPGRSHSPPRGHPPVHVEPVRASVERDESLVLPRLGRHGRQRLRRHVRRVHRDDVDGSAEPFRQRCEQVSQDDDPAVADVLRRDVDRVRFDVRGDQVERADPAEQRHRDRADPAAQVDDPVVALQPSCGLLDDDRGAGPWHEHPRCDTDAVSVERGPAEHDLERFAGEPTLHQAAQLHRVTVTGLEQQVGFVLGEHAARRPESGGQRGARRVDGRHGSARRSGHADRATGPTTRHRRTSTSRSRRRRPRGSRGR